MPYFRTQIWQCSNAKALSSNIFRLEWEFRGISCVQQEILLSWFQLQNRLLLCIIQLPGSGCFFHVLLSFWRCWAKVEIISSYEILKALSCMVLILLFADLLWNIQTNGQYSNWDLIKDYMITQRCFKLIYRETRDKAWSFWLAVLQFRNMFFKAHHFVV